MNTPTIQLAGAHIHLLPSGAMWWPEHRLLCVSDLHLGKAERMARRGIGLFPPYETAETLERLARAIDAHAPERVVCLGDSFDDCMASENLPEHERLWLSGLMAGRDWIWIEGNHDPGPIALAGRHLRQLQIGPLVLRHIAEAGPADGPGEISGHYHPKAGLGGRGGGIRRPCFLTDGRRLILPAFGAYTGGLDASNAIFAELLTSPARAILTGPTQVTFPVALP